MAKATGHEDIDTDGEQFSRAVPISERKVDRDTIQQSLYARANAKSERQTGGEPFNLKKGSEASQFQSAAEQYDLAREVKYSAGRHTMSNFGWHNYDERLLVKWKTTDLMIMLLSAIVQSALVPMIASWPSLRTNLTETHMQYTWNGPANLDFLRSRTPYVEVGRISAHVVLFELLLIEHDCIIRIADGECVRLFCPDRETYRRTVTSLTGQTICISRKTLSLTFANSPRT
jgi:hypothetical protein